SFFIPPQTVEPQHLKVPISNPFLHKKPNLIPFLFKPITTQPIHQLQKQNTTFKNLKPTPPLKHLHTQPFYAPIPIQSTIYPHFPSNQLTQAYTTQHPLQVPKPLLSLPPQYPNSLNNPIQINPFQHQIQHLQQ
ncbi:phage tail assembly chaperone, partial [Bacillus pumilus]|uniref:phage tail assembly chaperone n=1 Tax=Bacillus pumilus TaxID=1408 RepID=UPI00119D9A7D